MAILILNADDFGSSHEVNVAIVQAHTAGVLTSASLMVNEPCAQEAVALARRCPALAVGLHLAVSDGRAALGPGDIPHLAAAPGRFRRDPTAAGLWYALSPAARRELVCEITAQFDRFDAAGLPCDHVNGHQHLHVHPAIWDALVRQCEERGVRRLRIPHEEFRPYGAGRRARRLAEWAFFAALRRRCLRTLAGRGFFVPDRVYGHLETGHVSEAYLLDLLPRLAGTVNEVYMHPGSAHAARLADCTGDAGDTRDVESAALLSPRVRAAIEVLGLARSTYTQAAAMVGR